MNANPTLLSATAKADEAAIQPLPNSRKIYVTRSRPDIHVPMWKNIQSDTAASFGAEKNPPIYVYYTSGSYSDPELKIDIRSGLSTPRTPWILERDDTDKLPGPTSEYGVERLNDPKLAELCFDLHRKPRCAKAGKNVSQMYYA
ncbi:MAG: phosphomethylpyrimidine synthase ThiC, partial [Glaciimonas sp.]|nr:phosphomethylpyrimidine synthase ThiC [Glaciimonas sp.]